MWLLSNLGNFTGITVIFTSLYSTFFGDLEGIQNAYRFPVVDINRMTTIYNGEFPRDFLFGVATSAYQTEGAWNISGKGESIWDHMIHEYPTFTLDHKNGDVAADFYHKFKEDIKLAKNIGSKMFKFSLSWPRILPDGQVHNVNYEAFRYYNELIEELIKNEIEPMVTLFHWDLPYKLQQLGGFTNPLIVQYLTDYAEIAFTAFGDRVKYWATVHEPVTFCLNGYGGDQLFPSVNQSGYAEYVCVHNILLAQASIYDLYETQFRFKQNGKVGIILELYAFEPENPNSLDDRMASDRAFQWWNGWLFNPLFSELGDYPTAMKDRIALQSILQGYTSSRLPAFTEEEVQAVQNSADFVGIDYYTTAMVRSVEPMGLTNDTIMFLMKNLNTPMFIMDAGAEVLPIEWKAEIVLREPWKFAELLIRIYNDYYLPPIIITASGYKSDDMMVEDIERTAYYYQCMTQVLKAMQKGVDIRGYLASTLLDSFEWKEGYTTSAGIIKVDFESKNFTRTPRLSSKLLSNIYTTRTIGDIRDMVNATNMQKLENFVTFYETKK